MFTCLTKVLSLLFFFQFQFFKIIFALVVKLLIALTEQIQLCCFTCSYHINLQLILNQSNALSQFSWFFCIGSKLADTKTSDIGIGSEKSESLIKTKILSNIVKSEVSLKTTEVY